MTRIGRRFKKLRAGGEKALITYIMAGDPSMAKTRDMILTLEDAGVDIIELGVPFSDPLADGPTIQRASERALASGSTLKKVISLVADVRKTTEIPIVLMTYYNIIFRYGEKRFVADAVKSGVDGVIVSDLPPEEAGDFIRASREKGLDTIFLLAPTSTDDRISLISGVSRGFIYYVSLTGVTGVRERIAGTVRPMLEKIKDCTDKPVAVGFGISNPQQAAEIARWADGVVVGSALVQIIEEKAKSGDLLSSVRDFALDIKKGIG